MATRVITIARSTAAGGEQIAGIVAARLDMRLVDEEILQRAAHEAGVPRDLVAAVEQTQPLLVRIMQTFALAQPLDGEGGEPLFTPGTLPLPLEQLIVGVMSDIADERDCVIVGHGGSIAFSGRPNTLRVFATAPDGVRSDRLRQQQSLSERDAARALRYSDSQRADFLQRFFKVKRELPTHYDLVINTERLSYEAAAELVCFSAQSLSTS